MKKFELIYGLPKLTSILICLKKYYLNFWEIGSVNAEMSGGGESSKDTYIGI